MLVMLRKSSLWVKIQSLSPHPHTDRRSGLVVHKIFQLFAWPRNGQVYSLGQWVSVRVWPLVELYHMTRWHCDMTRWHHHAIDQSQVDDVIEQSQTPASWWNSVIRMPVSWTVCHNLATTDQPRSSIYRGFTWSSFLFAHHICRY